MCKIFVAKPERKRSFERPSLRWKDNIEIGLTEIRCVYTDWIHLVQYITHCWAFVNTERYLQFP